MANVIQLRKFYSEALDEVYKLASLTSVLDGDNTLVKEGANANELLIPKMSMDGLANYGRNSGYVNGSVTFEYETKKIGYDRGRMFTVDALDEMEATPVFSALSAEFVRTKVVPELDAYRLGAYASKAGIGSATGALANGKVAIDAVMAAKSAIKDAEASLDTVYLFIKSPLKDLIDGLDTTASRAALDGWAGIIEVPSSRFFKTITLNNGTTSGQEAGGFKGAGAINFLAVDKRAVIQFQKHTVNKIITPDQNQDADAWKFGYRTAGIAEVRDNKLPGIYAHTAQ